MKKKILILMLIALSFQITPIQSGPWGSMKDIFGTNAASSFRRTVDTNYSEQLTALGAIGVILTGVGVCSFFLKRPKSKTGRVANALTSATLSLGGVALALNTAAARDGIKVVHDVIKNALEELQK